MKVSIIIPVHNCGRYLAECLTSCATQTYRDIEILCVDDGSIDDSRTIISTFVSRDTRFRGIYFDENQGTHLARRAAVMAATGDYVLPLDGDDVLDERACERLAAAVCNRDFVLYGITAFVAEDVEATQFSDYAASIASMTALPRSEVVDVQAHLRAAFVDENVPIGPAGKMFRTAAVRRAFDLLPSGFCIGGEDGLVFYALLSSRPTGCSIPDRLYRYRLGHGVSTSVEKTYSCRLGWLRSGCFCARALKSGTLPTEADGAVRSGVWHCLVERPIEIAFAECPADERVNLLLDIRGDLPNSLRSKVLLLAQTETTNRGYLIFRFAGLLSLAILLWRFKLWLMTILTGGGNAKTRAFQNELRRCRRTLRQVRRECLS